MTTSVIIFPALFLMDSFLPKGVNLAVYHVLPALVGFLFILDFRIPKIDLVKLLKGRSV